MLSTRQWSAFIRSPHTAVATIVVADVKIRLTSLELRPCGRGACDETPGAGYDWLAPQLDRRVSDEAA